MKRGNKIIGVSNILIGVLIVIYFILKNTIGGKYKLNSLGIFENNVTLAFIDLVWIILFTLIIILAFVSIIFLIINIKKKNYVVKEYIIVLLAFAITLFLGFNLIGVAIYIIGGRAIILQDNKNE